MMSKEERERAILGMVYGMDDVAHVEKTERPDFAVSVPESRFGVEITELYDSEADARAINHPYYVPGLLAGGQHMHKDDIGPLSVCRVRISGPDGVTKQTDVPAIIRRLPSHAEKSSRLAGLIRRKSEQCAGHDASLRHVNLIVLDHSERALSLTNEYSTEHLLNEDLRSALTAMRFREAFLVTPLAEDERRVVPLRLVFLASEFFIFVRAIEALGRRHLVHSASDAVAAFAWNARRRGLHVDVVRGRGTGIEAHWGNATVTFDVGGGVSILDLRDRDPRARADHTPSRELTTASFAAELGEFCLANTFVCGISLPVVEDRDIGLDRRAPASERMTGT